MGVAFSSTYGDIGKMGFLKCLNVCFYAALNVAMQVIHEDILAVF